MTRRRRPLITPAQLAALQRENISLTTKVQAAEYAMDTMAQFVLPRIPADQNPAQATSFLAWIGMILRIEQRAERAEARLAAANKALEPFAACVFNDNGDVTYSYSDITQDDLWCAYKTINPQVKS